MEADRFKSFKSPSDLANMVLKMVKVEATTKSRVLTLSTRFSDPVLAAKIANEVLNAYIQVTEERARAFIVKTVDQMRNEITRLKKQVDDAHRKVKLYEVEHPQIASREVLESQIQHLNTELATVSSDRLTLRTELEELAAFQRQGADVRDHPKIAKDHSVEQILTTVQQKKVELTQLLNIYKERFPIVVEKRAELTTLEEIIGERKKQIVDEMKSKYILLAAREHELRKALDKGRAELSALLGEVAGYEALLGEVEVSKNIYSMLLERMDKASIIGRAEQSKVKVLSSAEIPQFPYSPQTARNVSLAFFIGLLVMSYMAYLFFLMLKPIDSAEEIVQGLKTSVLAQVPMVLSENEGEEVGLIVDQEGSFAKDALHVLRAALVSSGRNIFLFTSADPSEGKTFMVHNLGVFLAREGKRVLLVGTDFRDIRLKSRLKADVNHKSLEAYVSGKCSEQDLICSTSEPNLFYMGPEKVLKNSLEVITSLQFEALVRNVSRQFDYVFFDAPPVGLFPDSEMLCQIVKDVICLVRHGRTPYRSAAKAIETLRKSGANLIGVILNYRTLRVQDYYYHRYYYGKRGRKGLLMNLVEETRQYAIRIFKRWNGMLSQKKK